MIPKQIKKSRQHRFGNQVFRRIVGIPMRTNCAPLIADLVLYCYESQIMIRFKKKKTLSNDSLINSVQTIAYT